MLLFLTTYILSLPFLFVLLSLGVIFESYDNNGMAVFIGLCSMVVAYFMYDLQLITLVYFTVAYIFLGIVWSFWRYKRYVDQNVESCNAIGTSDHARNYMLEQIKLENMLGKITSWIIVWPLSMIENVTGDAVRLIKTLVSDTLKSVYTKIYANAIKNVKQ